MTLVVRFTTFVLLILTAGSAYHFVFSIILIGGQIMQHLYNLIVCARMTDFNFRSENVALYTEKSRNSDACPITIAPTSVSRTQY